MNLHHSPDEAEWESVTAGSRTALQRLAYATHGVITPGNLVTAAGFMLVIAGLWQLIEERYVAAMILVIIGRSADILDGILADITATKSPLGEALDAGLDKLSTFLTIAVFLITAIVPAGVVGVIVLPHFLVAGLTLFARARGVRLHPSRAGKAGMAALGAGLVGFIAGKAVNVPLSDGLWYFSYVAVLVSVVLGIYAFCGYAKEFRQR